MTTITVNEAMELIKDSNGKFFTVSFVKRTDNAMRTMNCRIGVAKNIKGTGHRKNNTGLLTVYEPRNKNYRNINVSGLRKLKINRRNYSIV